MLNTRKLEELKEKWLKPPLCGHSDQLEPETVSIQNVGGAYLIICVGIALACTALLIDFLYNLFGQKSKKKTKNKRINANPLKSRIKLG